MTVNNSEFTSISEVVKPWVLIPAYEPSKAVEAVVKSLLDSNVFQEIILVDDGSSSTAREYLIKLAEEPGVTLLTHAVNCGKGQALKTGLNYFLLNSSPNCPGLVTADADGQHLVKDIISVAKKGAETDCYTLGVRSFPPGIPFKSRFGNILTKHLFQFFTGVKVLDTQTGLRYIPRRKAGRHIGIPQNHFDYEFSVLVTEAEETGEKIVQIPISTVYIDSNKSSHFNPIRDTLSIYSVFLKYSSLSFVATIFDYFIFSFCFFLSHKTLLSFIAARFVAVIFMFTFSRQWVFKARHELLAQGIKYLAAVSILMFIAYNFTVWFSMTFETNVLIGKLISEGSLFFLSYYIQRTFIFRKLCH